MPVVRAVVLCTLSWSRALTTSSGALTSGRARQSTTQPKRQTFKTHTPTERGLAGRTRQKAKRHDGVRARVSGPLRFTLCLLQSNVFQVGVAIARTTCLLLPLPPA